MVAANNLSDIFRQINRRNWLFAKRFSSFPATEKTRHSTSVAACAKTVASFRYRAEQPCGSIWFRCRGLLRHCLQALFVCSAAFCGTGAGHRPVVWLLLRCKAEGPSSQIRLYWSRLLLRCKTVDIKMVSGMLGHYSAGFTLDTYAHVTTAAQREAAKTMGNILSGAL